jgi:hypothetical protein
LTRRDNQQLVTRLRATISPAIIASPRHQTLIQVVAAPSSRSSRYNKEFKGRQFTAEVILWAVRWYLMFPISYRDRELIR